jgi:hypothetical protein
MNPVSPQLAARSAEAAPNAVARVFSFMDWPPARRPAPRGVFGPLARAFRAGLSSTRNVGLGSAALRM